MRNMEMVGGKERAVAKIASKLSNYYPISILNLEASTQSFYPIDPKVQLFSCSALNFLGKPKGFKTALFFWQGIREIARFMKQEQPSLVIGNDFLINIMLVLAKILVRVDMKIIGWEHVTLEEPIISSRPRLRRLRNFFYKKLTRLVVITQSDASFCQKHAINSFLIPYPQSFPFHDTIDYTQERILTIARLSHQKGIDLYLQLIANLKDQLHNWRFILVAKEDDITYTQLKAMIKQYEVGDYIDIEAPSSHVVDFYKRSSIFLLTSRYEGLPITLIEAQTCGLPCVSFDCKTGPADIIHSGADGFVVPAFSLEEMQISLMTLIRSEALRRSMGLEAKVSAKRFDEAHILARWHQLICELTVHLKE